MAVLEQLSLQQDTWFDSMPEINIQYDNIKGVLSNRVEEAIKVIQEGIAKEIDKSEIDAILRRGRRLRIGVVASTVLISAVTGGAYAAFYEAPFPIMSSEGFFSKQFFATLLALMTPSLLGGAAIGLALASQLSSLSITQIG